jgi:hypothetical protein
VPLRRLSSSGTSVAGYARLFIALVHRSLPRRSDSTARPQAGFGRGTSSSCCTARSEGGTGVPTQYDAVPWPDLRSDLSHIGTEGDAPRASRRAPRCARRARCVIRNSRARTTDSRARKYLGVDLLERLRGGFSGRIFGFSTRRRSRRAAPKVS